MAELTDFEMRSMPGLLRWYDQSARAWAYSANGAKSREETLNWQHGLREIVAGLLGGKPHDRGEMAPQVISSERIHGYTRELVVIQTDPGETMPCYVLIPDAGQNPYKPVIALHGHGTAGAQGIIGLGANDPQFDPVRDMNADYAHQLALRGYLVFAPVLRGFAERLEDRTASNEPATGSSLWLSSCQSLGLTALLCGKTLLGLRVWDVLRLIDYIRTRPEPMTDTLGCVGLSGGGTITLFTAALDERITCAVVSGYLNTFRDSIMSIDHCVCNFVPGILRYAEMPDIAGLIAPRPLLVESGLSDPIYPVVGTRRALDELRPVYAALDADERLDADIFAGGHRWSGQKAYAWLERWL